METGRVECNLAVFIDLYQKVKRGKRRDLAIELRRMEAELASSGYKIEHAWGHYLHCPDGQVIILDDWNE